MPASLAVAAPPAAVFAHGIGGRSDLPIPFGLALGSSALVLVVSFAALAVLWPRPRLGSPTAGWRLPAALARALDAGASRWVVRLVALAFFGYVLAAALLGVDDAQNPTAGVVYVLFWVGAVAFASAVLGPVWRWLNPMRTLYLLGCAALRRDPSEGLLPYPARLGSWPAAAGLLCFAWLELVAPQRDTLTVLQAWFGAYFGLMLTGAVVFGSTWFDQADGFQVASQLYGRLSALGRRPADHAWVLRSPLDGVASAAVRPGLAATVCVMLGSTMYDAGANSTVWIRVEQSGAMGVVTAGTVGLVGTVLVVMALYLGAVTLAGRLGGGSDRAGTAVRSLPGVFAPSVVPIALGYVVAHYYSLLVLTGQSTVGQLADPLGTGSNLLGLGGRPLLTGWVQPSFVASFQVSAIVVGHVIGVVVAHDRAVGLFPRGRAVAGQLPLLALMVLFTITGLLLLFAA
jgi:hypothetical protein